MGTEKLDLINGGFEFFSGVLQILNIIRLVKDKKVQGISIVPFIFFTLWGYWNLAYYPLLGQTLSFAGGILIVTTNTIWLALYIKYKKYGK